jgi:hypothetical protein
MNASVIEPRADGIRRRGTMESGRSKTMERARVMSFSLDVYDYPGYIVPGMFLLLGLAVFFPWIKHQFGEQKVELSGIGSFLIIAFILGHMLHGLGHEMIERPMRAAGLIHHTDKVVDGTPDFPSKAGKQDLVDQIKRKFPQIPIDGMLTATWKDNEAPWYDLVKRINVEVINAKKNDRVEVFNRIYGLHLGLATGCLVLIGAYFWAVRRICRTHSEWPPLDTFSAVVVKDGQLSRVPVCMIAAGILLLLAIALYRMNEFSNFYARELFATFTSLERPSLSYD